MSPHDVPTAGQMVAVARGSMLPHVNLSLQRDFYSQDNLFGDDARSWTLGVYATWDIFKGMQNIGEIKKAKARKRAAEHMADFETRQASVQATEAWLSAQAALEKVAVAGGAVQHRRDACHPPQRRICPEGQPDALGSGGCRFEPVNQFG